MKAQNAKERRMPKKKNNEKNFDIGEYADIFGDMGSEEREEHKEEEEWEEIEKKDPNEGKKRVDESSKDLMVKWTF